MKSSLMLIFSFCFFQFSYAAIPSQKTRSQESLEAALRLPIENRVDVVRSQGPQALKKLARMAQDQNQSLNHRWKSLTLLSRISPTQAKPVVEASLRSTEWFMRNAGLVALRNLKPQVMKKWSIKLLKDPALVVRTAAATNLSLKLDSEARQVLWRSMFSKQNRHRGQSLWIRGHIARMLGQAPRKSEGESYLKLMSDEDPLMQKFGVNGLRKIYGDRFSNFGRFADQKRAWASFLSQKNKSSIQ